VEWPGPARAVRAVRISRGGSVGCRRERATPFDRSRILEVAPPHRELRHTDPVRRVRTSMKSHLLTGGMEALPVTW